MLNKFLKSIGYLSAASKQSQLTIPVTASFSINFKKPVRIAVTGCIGQTGYATLFRIASGEMLGKYQPVILQLLDLTSVQQSLNGIKLELHDCSFPLL